MISQIQPIPAFTHNYIWAISDQEHNSACVVDPGDATPVISYLEAHHLKLVDILITQHYPDHTGGLKKLIAKYSPKVCGPGSSNISGISNYVSEGDQVELFGPMFFVIDAPGHTLDHIANYSQSDSLKAPILFCGDTTFAGGCGRLFEGTPAVMRKSVSKHRALQPTTEVYCTHEYTLAHMKFSPAADPDNVLLIKRLTSEQGKRESLNPPCPPVFNSRSTLTRFCAVNSRPCRKVPHLSSVIPLQTQLQYSLQSGVGRITSRTLLS
ncbi:MAG: hydroxyacylglutathione hydrolase [Proteobacteria bacterium]|nr:hydroxyacylglutathione hydrolase [Pseudomonadota bacterium]